MKILSNITSKFYSWLDGLSNRGKAYAFLLATFGWIPFMFGNSLAIWSVGYTWFCATGIFYTLLFLRG